MSGGHGTDWVSDGRPGTAGTPSPLTTSELADRLKIKEVVAVAYSERRLTMALIANAGVGMPAAPPVRSAAYPAPRYLGHSAGIAFRVTATAASDTCPLVELTDEGRAVHAVLRETFGHTSAAPLDGVDPAEIRTTRNPPRAVTRRTDLFQARKRTQGDRTKRR
jgi:hypothetical protein